MPSEDNSRPAPLESPRVMASASAALSPLRGVAASLAASRAETSSSGRNHLADIVPPGPATATRNVPSGLPRRTSLKPWFGTSLSPCRLVDCRTASFGTVSSPRPVVPEEDGMSTGTVNTGYPDASRPGAISVLRTRFR